MPCHVAWQHVIMARADQRQLTVPEERAQPGMAGELLKMVYNTHGAASTWMGARADHQQERGFTIGVAKPAIFHGKLLMGVCHGDDFMMGGGESCIV